MGRLIAEGDIISSSEPPSSAALSSTSSIDSETLEKSAKAHADR